MPKAIAAFETFCESNQWRCEVVDESTLRGVVSGHNAQWPWYVNEGKSFLVFHGLCPVRVPRGKRPLAAEYLARANYGLLWGNFELDWSDGEVRFKTVLALDGQRAPSNAQLEHLAFGNCWALDRYLPGLFAILYGKLTPRQAIKEAEADKAQEHPDDDEESEIPQNVLDRLTPGEN
jgi:hypothetical protein